MIPARADVVALIVRQLGGPSIDSMTSGGHSPRVKSVQWHYGVQELRELLDFIYGQPPQDESEQLPHGLITNPDRLRRPDKPTPPTVSGL